ncbi:MAG: CHASE3 domain-containing protein [Verrucomicrobia bacterium]|nr:CHASE3 domain-containing protein [Verrucomicrobiota bacterium]
MKINLNKTRRVQILVATGFCLPLITLFVATLLTYSSTKALWDTFQWVPFSQRVEESLSSLLDTVENIELAQRGFLLTGQDAYLVSIDKGRSDIAWQIDRARVMTSEEPEIEVHFTKLAPLIVEKMKLCDQTIALKRAAKGEEAIQILLSDNSMQEINDNIGKMRAAESGIRLKRELAAGAKARETERALMWLMALDVLVISIVIVLLLHLRRLQKYVTMCAWSKTILDKNEWVSIDEYLRRTYDVKVSHGISEAEREKFMAKAGLPSIPPVKTVAAGA